MKKLIAMILTLTSLSAVAGDIKIYDIESNNLYNTSTITPDFGINAELGRAWVNIVFSSSAEAPIIDDERVKVPGLSFDKDSNQIVLESETGKTVCANVKFSRLLGARIRNTGKCTFSQNYYTVKVDNGYEIESVERFKITLHYK